MHVKNWTFVKAVHESSDAISVKEEEYLTEAIIDADAVEVVITVKEETNEEENI